jgi:CheY-like chemotaxis protein
VWLPSHGNYEGDLEKMRQVPIQGKGQTIMVVDDEVALVELAEERLAYLGYEPVGFHTAETALAAFEADPQRFDALLCDEMLPGMAGTELTERIRGMRPGFPVFIMSGKVTTDLEERVHAVGADMLLRKPLQMSDIADALSRLSAIERETL